MYASVNVCEINPLDIQNAFKLIIAHGKQNKITGITVICYKHQITICSYIVYFRKKWGNNTLPGLCLMFNTPTGKFDF